MFLNISTPEVILHSHFKALTTILLVSGFSIFYLQCIKIIIGRATVDQLTDVCLATWPVCGNEAGVDIVLIETFSYVNHVLMLTNVIYI